MPTTTRKLAAIMFTDIVGYTALMGADEDLAFEILRTNREIHSNTIREFHGILIKEIGDGILAKFDGAVDAVQCAINIQKSAVDKMEAAIRIGIHLGDITFENNDVFGDGVNIAARLQSVADAGGIYISESVQRAIRSKKAIQTSFLGQFRLKNVDYKVSTYCIQGDGFPHPDTAKLKKLEGKSDISSLAILPFDNYTGDEGLEYFVSGMHTSLIWDIGKISALRVTSKTSSRAYKNTDKSIPEIASELGVDAVVEASVLGIGEGIQLMVKLIAAFPEEKNIWDKEYYEDKSKVLGLYNKITKEISEEINIILTPHEEKLLTESRTVNNEAYEAYLKAQVYWESLGNEDLDEAMKYFNIAVEKDADWSAPHAGLSLVWIGKMQMGWTTPDVAIPMINKYLNKALELNPKSSQAHYVSALVAVWTEWDWAKGEKEFLTALELNPNDSLARIYYAHLLMSLRRPNEAVQQAELALSLDPLRPLLLGLYSVVKTNIEDYRSAIEQGEKAVSIEPENFFAAIALEFAYFNDQEYQKSLDIIKQYYPLEEDAKLVMQQAYDEHGYNEAMKVRINSIKNSAFIDLYPPHDIGMYYMRIGDIEGAIDCFEKAYEIHDPNLPYISTDLYQSDELEKHSKYRDLLQKMNLPPQRKK